MILPIVLSPSIFNFENLSKEETLYLFNLLKMLFKNGFGRAIYIFDDKDFISSNILSNINEIKDQNIKLFLIKIIKNILSNQYKKIKSSYTENELEQLCSIFINILQNDSNAYGIYANINSCTDLCDSCIKKFDTKSQCININNYYDSKLEKCFNTSNLILYKDYKTKDFCEEFIKPIIKYSNKIKIYDRQISSINAAGNDIKDNFKHNINFWVKYFYSVNNKIQIEIYTSCKDAHNKKLITMRLEDIKNSIKSLCANINLKISLIDDNIHERYFCTDLIMFSCDRGIDLINQDNNLYDDIHISIIKSKEGDKIRNLLV